MKPDDESLHAVPFDPVRDSLLSLHKDDWALLDRLLGGFSCPLDINQAEGLRATLTEVRDGLHKPVPHKPLPVPGYKAQNDPAIQLVGTNKLAEERSLRILDDLQKNPNVDERWLAIGRTAMEQAWMAVNRAVFKPDRARLPED